MIEKDFILLIPQFNNYAGLINSIKSVQYQNNRFEILIVDDGSDIPLDNQTLQEFNPNIHLIRLPKNLGVLKALNTGLAYLQSRNDFKYIARLDCGDICHPDRFNKQVTFLDEHPEISLLGTWCHFIEKTSKKYYLYKTKIKHNDILKEMHYKCSFIHPTVMFRKEILEKIGYYPNGFIHAEDYAYFWMILKKMKGEILPKVLVDIEYSTNNISAIYYRKQLKSKIKITIKFGDNLFLIILGLYFKLIRFLIPLRTISYFKFSKKNYDS